METANNEQNELHISQLHNWLQSPQQDTFIREHVIPTATSRMTCDGQQEVAFLFELTFFGGGGAGLGLHRTLLGLALNVQPVERPLQTPHRLLRVALLLGNAAVEAVHEGQAGPHFRLIAPLYFGYFLVLQQSQSYYF